MVHLEAISGLGNQKKSLLINGLVALGDSLHPLQYSWAIQIRLANSSDSFDDSLATSSIKLSPIEAAKGL